jgi:hypothetical protein
MNGSGRLLLPQDEFEAVKRAWKWLLESGHANCGAPRRDPSWAPGHYACGCGQMVLIVGGAR